MPWLGFAARFGDFCADVDLTTDQIDDGFTKARGITASLNTSYYGHNRNDLNGFLVGSWGKGTAARPPNDVDLFYRLPDAMFSSINGRLGNKQSQLLQEVKTVLQATYPQTDMRGDGQVVVVGFNSLMVEVVPAFMLQNGTYIICDTNNGGSWKPANPVAEMQSVQQADLATGGALRSIIKMLKVWKRHCNVPLKSYLLETLALEFLPRSPWGTNGFHWYDWMIRDFLGYLIARANTWIIVPDGQSAFLGNEWKSRAETAYSRAVLACEYEKNDQLAEAGDEWQKIFGNRIRKYVTPRLSL